MGVVAERPADLASYYDDAYYHGEGPSSAGYTEYAVVAAHSLAWAAELVRLVQPSGRVLDVGAADGYLLGLLGDAYDRAAIEVNATLRAKCVAAGFAVLGADICSPALVAEHGGSFDAVTAIAVLEHVGDMRRAVEQIRDLLTPTGVMVFEVPLISPTADNKVWFNSSLEHVFYPTAEGLAHLFESVFGLPLIGREVYLQDYASTFVGVVTKSPERHVALADRFRTVLDAPIEELADPAERRFRLLFELVHAAHTRADTVALLPALGDGQATVGLLHRLGALWSRDLGRLASGDDQRARELAAELADSARRAEQAEREAAGATRLVVRQALEAESARRRLAEEAEASHDRESFLAERHRELEQRSQSTQRHFVVLAEEAAARRQLAEEARAAREAELDSARGELALLRGSRSFRLVERIWHARARWSARLRRLLERPPEKPADATVALAPTPQAPQWEPWPADRPLVSVVIPCYNYGQYVTDAVDSVLGQTFGDLEILVVDGGSDAPTVDVLRRLSRPRTQVFFRQGRHLVGDNRNFGIERARGRYVACLDADDILRPTYLAKALYLLERQAFDVVSTSIQCFGENADAYQLKRFPTLSDMVAENQLATCSVFRKTLWEKAGGYQDSGTGADYFYEDWRLWIRFAALGARLCNLVDEPLMLYRVHSDQSLSRQNRTVPNMDRQRDAMLKLNRDVLEAAAAPTFLPLAGAPPSEDWARRWGTSRSAQPTVIFAIPFLIVGGAERLWSAITRHLAARGFRVVIVTTEHVYAHYGDGAEWFAESTRDIYQLPRFLDRGHWRDFILGLLAAHDDALLWLAGSTVFYDLLPEIAAAFPRMPIIDQLFNTVGHTANNRKHRQRFARILVETAEVAQWLLDAGESVDKVVRISSGIDLETYRPRPRSTALLEQLSLTPETFLAGFSGRLAEEKDPLAFVDIARLCRTHPRVAFVMTGDGPLAVPTRERIAELGVADRLHFLGRIPCVTETMASYDALVLPSRFDGRPLAALESLALGVPVIASRVGALPDLIEDGVTGFLCEPGDVGAFAERIRWLAANPAEHARMKLAARAFAERELGDRRMLADYEAVVRELLGRAEKPSLTERSRALAAP
jgi:glycosyltransferase involved in cell wall biosynthesis/SAM-dependent methyltransferase